MLMRARWDRAVQRACCSHVRSRTSVPRWSPAADRASSRGSGPPPL